MTKSVKNRVLKHLNYLKSFGYEYHEPFNFSSNNINNIKLPNSINELNSIIKSINILDCVQNKNVDYGFFYYIV